VNTAVSKIDESSWDEEVIAIVITSSKLRKCEDLPHLVPNQVDQMLICLK